MKLGWSPSRTLVAPRIDGVRQHPRYRAIQARRLRVTLVRSSLVLAAISALGGLPLAFMGSPTGILLAADGFLDAAIWVGIAVAAPRVGRRMLVPLAVLCFLLMLPGAFLTMSTTPSAHIPTIGYLAVIPLAVALVVPWGSRAHALWVVIYIAATTAYAASPWSGALDGEERDGLVFAITLAGAASVMGHVISRRFRLREFAEHLRLRHLNARVAATSAELERANLELRDTLAHLRRFEGLLPICAECKSIRDEAGSWQRLEKYVSEHSEAVFSHGLCPTCLERLYPEFAHEPQTGAPPPG